MSEKTTAVYGIFYDNELVQKSVRHLLAAQFAETEIDVHDPQKLGTKDLAHDRDSRAGSSTAAVTSSVAIGGTLGLAVGAGAMAIPGVGPLLAAGPFLGALAGFAAGGVAGGAMDALDAASLPDLGIRKYEGHIREGGILVTVQCVDAEAVRRAEEVLQQTGAQAISQS